MCRHCMVKIGRSVLVFFCLNVNRDAFNVAGENGINLNYRHYSVSGEITGNELKHIDPNINIWIFSI